MGNGVIRIQLTSRAASQTITKTRLYNFDPLQPHFYIVKLGSTGYTFLISAQKHRLWVLVRTRLIVAVLILTSTHNLCFKQNYEIYQNFLPEKFHFLVVKFSVYLNGHVFIMNLTKIFAILQYIQRCLKILDREDPDQIAEMCRLIWGLSCWYIFPYFT